MLYLLKTYWMNNVQQSKIELLKKLYSEEIISLGQIFCEMKLVVRGMSCAISFIIVGARVNQISLICAFFYIYIQKFLISNHKPQKQNLRKSSQNRQHFVDTRNRYNLVVSGSKNAFNNYV